jgi:hypothetical protein
MESRQTLIALTDVFAPVTIHGARNSILLLQMKRQQASIAKPSLPPPPHNPTDGLRQGGCLEVTLTETLCVQIVWHLAWTIVSP